MGPRTTPLASKLSPAVNSILHGSDMASKLLSSARNRILVVDGDPETCQVLALVLGSTEYELLEVRSTTDAFAVISMGRVDLILIDSDAPGVGGVEFCRTLRNAPATQLIPILILSRESGVEQEIVAIESGANEFIAKPLQARSLRARIQANLWRKSLIDSQDDSEAVLFSLAQSVEARDPELGQHCERIAVMCAAIGVSLGLPPQDILALQRGGYLHDVGKVVIPDSILFKPDKLTPEEWSIMEGHTERGEMICSSMRSMAAVLPIIRHHHERWDGSGYPDRLKGESIPLLARILQVADIYDALTTARAYKPAMSPEQAIRTLREEASRGWRDPNLVEVFAGIMPMFRPSSAVDYSRYSLQALATTLDTLGKGPMRIQPGTTVRTSSELKLVSGL